MTPLQVDLATAVARLRQIRGDGYDNGHWLLDRVITCDLPRLERHLSAEARAAVDVASPARAGRRGPWWARRFRPAEPKVWEGDQT